MSRAGTVWDEVRRYVVDHLGHPDGVLIADDTSAIKKGDKSAGVARQYCGLIGHALLTILRSRASLVLRLRQAM